MTDWNVFEHHRGPYVFGVMRETPKRKMKYHYDALPGKVEVDDIREEARALLSDKRDTITSVYVYSVSEEQHVTTYTRRDFDLA
jgi:hypothetical protein